MNRALPIYFVAVALLSLGMYIHVVLFNLYLSDLGQREDTMGRLAGAMTLGTAFGTVAGAIIARRYGLRGAAVLSAAGLALALALRAVAPAGALVPASVLCGLFLGGWFVTNAPAIAALAGRSATAFSVNAALGIGIGAAAGIAAAQLPRWFAGASPAASKRAALLVSAILVAAAAAVVSSVRFGERPQVRVPGALSITLLRRSPARAFAARFLIAVSVWYAFANGLIPFFSVYFQNALGASLESIGGIFSISQLVQAAAVLLMAPFIARVGLSRAVIATQLLAAVTVAGLFPVRSVPVAAGFYLIALSLYVMTEPGLQNLLMSGVPAAEREAAAAANLLVMFAVQAVVATAAGSLIAWRGYPALFIALALTGLLAAALTALLPAARLPAETVPPANAAGNSAARSE